MTEAQILQIPFLDPGIIDLGPSNGSALKRLANYAGALVKSGEPIPPSPFCEWAASRVCGQDKQDLTIFIQGRRGSGKSYSALWIATRVAEAIARRMGGTWQDYFSLENIAALEDTQQVMKILERAGKRQIILVDDCSLAISNRSWNSPENKSFNALLTTARTQRWIIIMTAPLRAHVDVQTREMTDITATVYRSFHEGGFNILKAVSSELSSGQGNKEYTKRLNFSGRKIDFWVTFKPTDELVRGYDVIREEGAKTLNKRIVETGTFHSKGNKGEIKTTAERNLEKMIAAHGEGIKAAVKQTPDISMNGIAAKFAISHQQAARICERMGIKVKSKNLK